MVERICVEEVDDQECEEDERLVIARQPPPGRSFFVPARVSCQATTTTTALATSSHLLRLSNPFNNSQAYGNQDPEVALKWLLEKHVLEPFETAKADFAEYSLKAYGQDLATQLVNTGLIPKKGDVELEIISSNLTPPREGAQQCNLQTFHWEVLADPKLWPSTHKLHNVSVIRTVRGCDNPHRGIEGAVVNGRKFRILLVVSRPGQEEDIDHGLVSRLLVSILNDASSQVDAALTVLRPPTWEEFRDHLQEHNYDLVHLDMHGKVKTNANGNKTAGLVFCKPDLLNPLKLKPAFRTGAEVAKVLAASDVKTVVLNACESASSRYSQDANLASVLLKHGVHSVVAQAYQVVDEAVEIFNNIFYQSLFVNKTSIEDATYIARQALMQNRQRRAALMYKISLSDYIVPVLYTHHSEPTTDKSRSYSGSPTSITWLENAFESTGLAETIVKTTTLQKLMDEPRLIGRDLDIQALEVLLSISRVILLHGPGGCGKSELLRYLCQWWKTSGWIKGFAHVDFDRDRPTTLSDVFEKIGRSIGLDADCRSQTQILAKLNRERHLVVFDSEDVLSTPCKMDRLNVNGGNHRLEEGLRNFLLDVDAGASSVAIISSRLSETKIGQIVSERQKYHLSGIGVLGAVELFQRLAFEDGTKPPEMYHRRENIDYLRRVAILLEANPAAIQIVIKAFRQAEYDGKALHHELLYGACDLAGGGEWSCRMYSSVLGSLAIDDFTRSDESLMYTYQYGIFWNIMPEDLTMYYWFTYISVSKYFQEGTYANWISEEFEEIVRGAQMARNLKTYWHGIEAKMMAAGFISRATITRHNGAKVPCYHVHPIFTLLSRAQQPDVARFGYIRHTLLWENRRDGEGYNFASVEWDGVQQHEDHLHNMRAIALEWSVSDGDLTEEIERMGVSLFDVTYPMCIDTLHLDGRTAALFLPIIWKHVLRLYMLVDLIRPEGLPTLRDLDSILAYSEVLYRLAANERFRIPIVNNALALCEKYRSSSGASALNKSQQLSWFQLRHAEACLTIDSYDGRKLYGRNLADDPDFGPEDEDGKAMYNAIRRVQLQNVMNWAGCDVQCAAREKALDKQKGMARLKESSGAIVAAGGMTRLLLNVPPEVKDIIATLKVRDQVAFSLERHKDGIFRFGDLTQSILDCSMTDIYADISGDKGDFLDMVQQVTRLTTARDRIHSKLTSAEAAMHMLAGDMTSAASALGADLEREALSSTSSTRWEAIADLHTHMYVLAVERADPPDYSKGLTHLENWWKLHGGVGVSKIELCYAHLKFAICYHGLNRIVEAAREVLKCVQQTVPGLTMADFEDGDDPAQFLDYLYERFADLTKLDVFLQPLNILFGPASISSLSWQERARMFHVMTKAHEAKQTRKECDDQVAELNKAREERIESMKKYLPLMKALAKKGDATGDSALSQGLEEYERRLKEWQISPITRASSDDWLG